MPNDFASFLREKLGHLGSFARSITSGEAEPHVVAARTAQCGLCPSRVDEPRGSFCGACGCPRTNLAELGRNLRVAYREGPRRRPGFSNAEAADATPD